MSLVRLGRERNIPGLEGLCDDLVTLETLVYEASSEPNLSLKELQQLADIDKLRLLLKGVSWVRRHGGAWLDVAGAGSGGGGV